MKLTGNSNWLCERNYASLHAGNLIQFVYCDGHVGSLSPSIDGLIYESMATIDGGEVIPGM